MLPAAEDFVFKILQVQICQVVSHILFSVYKLDFEAFPGFLARRSGSTESASHRALL